VTVLLAVVLIPVLVRDAFGFGRRSSVVSLALEEFLIEFGLQLACVAAVWHHCLCDGGCLGALLFAWCSLLLVALRMLRHCTPRCLLHAQDFCW
jgi:hypothetical protein